MFSADMSVQGRIAKIRLAARAPEFPRIAFTELLSWLPRGIVSILAHKLIM